MKIANEKIIRRLRIIEGQIKGLQDMVTKDVDCVEIVTQSSAIKQGLSRMEDLLLEDHLNNCVKNQSGKGQSNNLISDVLKVYRLKRV